MLVYAETKNCERCIDAELCEFARAEIRRAVAHVNYVAELARRKLPDADVTVDCHSFSPRRKS